MRTRDNTLLRPARVLVEATEGAEEIIASVSDNNGNESGSSDNGRTMMIPAEFGQNIARTSDNSTSNSSSNSSEGESTVITSSDGGDSIYIPPQGSTLYIRS